MRQRRCEEYLVKYLMNTYAQLVFWYTVRLGLILTCFHDINTQYVDLSNEFYQAEIKKRQYSLYQNYH